MYYLHPSKGGKSALPRLDIFQSGVFNHIHRSAAACAAHPHKQKGNATKPRLCCTALRRRLCQGGAGGQHGQNSVPPPGCQVTITGVRTERIFLASTHTHTTAKNLQGSSLHIWTSDIERNADIKLVWHGLAFHQPKLPNMIPMVCRVYYIRVVQFTCFNQRIVNLKKGKTKQEIHSS